MKTFIVAAMACCGLLGAVDGARAGGARLILSPPDTSFQIRGDFTLFNNSDPLKCKVTFSGTTSAGGDKRHAGEITGGMAKGSGCRDIEFLNFPWNIVIYNTKGGYISPVTYHAGDNNCRVEVLFAISANGVWVLGNPSSCGLEGSGKSTPSIAIVRQ